MTETTGGRRPRRRASRFVAAIGLAAGIALLAGCAGPGLGWEIAEPEPTETTPVEIDFYAQEVDWVECEDTFECATITAPLTWDDLEAGSIELALIRKPATGDKIGSLFMNPGGPGGSGIDSVLSGMPSLSREMRDAYDLVGFDPRGVGQSSPIVCYPNDQDLDEYIYGDPDDLTEYPEPGTDEYYDYAEDEIAEHFAACEENTGEVLEYVDTWQVAQDLDLMRALVGDEKLNYIGYSYGTYIGAFYAAIFPENTGRMVLDGAIDPTADSFDADILQAKAFEATLNGWAQDCIDGGSCPFGSTPAEVIATLQGVVDELDEDPLTGSDGRLLWGSTFVTSVLITMYSDDYWDLLTQALEGVQAGDTTMAFLLADSYNGRNPDGSYNSNIMTAISPIRCLDAPAITDRAEVERRAAALKAAAPFWGPQFSYGEVFCENWPYKYTERNLDFTAEGSAPILVVGTTGDSATPYEDAIALADLLDQGVLISYEGEQHTVYGQGVRCIDDVVNAYYLTGKAPSSDPWC